MSQSSIPLVVSYREAAKMIGGEQDPVSTAHIGRLVRARKLKAIGRSKARRILYKSVIDYLEGESGNG